MKQALIFLLYNFDVQWDKVERVKRGVAGANAFSMEVYSKFSAIYHTGTVVFVTMVIIVNMKCIDFHYVILWYKVCYYCLY